MTRFGVRNLLLAAVTASSLFAGCAVPRRTRPLSESVPALVLTQVPVGALKTPAYARFSSDNLPPGTRIVLWDPAQPRVPRVLTTGFAVAADPCVSFNGDSLLFAGKKNAADPWDIWVMALSGGAPRQITRGMGDCREAVFLPLSSISGPDFTDKVRWIAFTSTADSIRDGHGLRFAQALYCRSLDSVKTNASVLSPGYVTWRSTYNLAPTISPFVLEDGRVAYSNPPVLSDTSAFYGFMTVNWEGTDPNPFFGLTDGATRKSMGVEAPNRSFIYVESDGTAPLGSGELARVWMRRPMHTFEQMSDGVGLYAYPYILPDNRLIVSYSRGGNGFGIYLFGEGRKSAGEVLFDDPAWAELDAQAVVVRPEPLGRITMIVDSRDFADLHCMNVYDSQLPEVRFLPKGSIRKVRVMEFVPAAHNDGRVGQGDAPTTQRIIGEGIVEEDGSFNLRVPAATPLSFHLLDSSGAAVARMRSAMWVGRRDQRGCIGCHENPELAPENRSTQALLRLRADTLMTPLHLRRAYSFARDVKPIIERSCSSCHADSHRSGITLAGEPRQVYRSLIDRRPGSPRSLVSEGRARESLLVWAVHGRPLLDGDHRVRPMPPRSRLSAEDIQTITTWVDVGAPYE